MTEDTGEQQESFLKGDCNKERGGAGQICPYLQSQEAGKLGKSDGESATNGKSGCKYGGHGAEGGKESRVWVDSEPQGTECVLSFHGVGYRVVERQAVQGGCCCCRQPKERHILNNVSGLCEPGMNAILGPTGSGKTSLLDVLAARKDPRGLIGQVLVNGRPQPHNFKCMAGYVIQDDIVMGMLTVRENIAFSAALRLPSSTSPQQRRDRVEETISDLGLTKCADTKVGSELMRGVSGGERKRTNIAMELITAPQVLFLDEPTTGLDANTAHSVMHLLQRLSRRGKTIIFSVHQPRYSIFKLFDRMLLLSQGELVYQGAARSALQHFNDMGYQCEEHNNPPDFFLDVLNGGLMPLSCPARLPSVGADPEAEKVDPEKMETQQLFLEVEEGADVMAVRQTVLVERYRQSKYHLSMKERLEPIVRGSQTQTDTDPTDAPLAPKYSTSIRSSVPETLDTITTVQPRLQYATSFLTQFGVVSGRTWQNMIRNRHTMMSQTLSAVILGLLVGAIYFQVDHSFTSGIQNRVGAFFFIVMNYVFGNMSAVDIFIKDRAIFIHENISGFYRVSSYFFAKLCCDVVPQRALPILVFSLITYWMIGLESGAAQFCFYLCNILLTCLAGTSVALVFSASTSTHTVGTVLTALIWVLMMVFSGLLVNLQTVPHFLRWLKWFSIFRYSMNGFMVNELKDQVFCDDGPTNSTALNCDWGNAYMSRQGIPHSTSWDLWQNEMALALLSLGFLALTYIQLRRMKKLK